MKNSLISLSILVLSITACGKSSSSDDKGAVQQELAPLPVTQDVQEGEVESETQTPDLPAQESEEFVEATGQVLTKEVDATSREVWAYFDLDSNSLVAEGDATWDLAFKATTIKLNTGVLVSNLKETPFDIVPKSALDGPFASDAPVAGGLETDGLYFHTPEAWYAYDINLHVVNMRNYLYIVKSNGGNDIKLTFTDYYNVDRLPRFIQLKTQIIGLSAAAE